MWNERNNRIFVLRRRNSYFWQIAIFYFFIKFDSFYARECEVEGLQVFYNSLKPSLDEAQLERIGPKFEVDFYNISIVENLPNGFSVLQVVAHDRVQNEEFIYELDDDSGAFLIDSNSGWLIVRNSSILDREKRSIIRMKVYAFKKSFTDISNTNNVVNFSNVSCSPTTVASSTFANVELLILDVNDNNPIFLPSNYYVLTTLSNSNIGAILGKVHAIDKDEGKNGLVSYRLQRSENITSPFAVDIFTGEISVRKSPIMVGKYIIFVEAMDNPLNPSEKRFSLAVVTINVIQSPVFQSESLKFIGTPYKFWIQIDAPIGSTAGQIFTNNVMKDKYLFDLLHSYRDGVPFAIEEKSGVITVVDEIRKYKNHFYEFEAVIVENNDIVLLTNVTIIINSELKSINIDNNIDNKRNKTSSLQSPQIFHISENSNTRYIGQVKSIKSKLNENVKFYITNQKDVSEIGITNDGFLYTNHSLDREEKENYNITVAAETLAEIETIHIVVIVDDENDNAPLFNSNSYEGYIFENSPLGTQVTMKNKIFAFDLDNNINGTFVYKIFDDGNGDSSLFEIEMNSGIIFYKGSSKEDNLDREIKSIYNMKIVAIDKGNLQSVANLTITVKDINDNAPSFTKIKMVLDKSDIQVLGFAKDTDNTSLIADSDNYFIHKDEKSQHYYLSYYNNLEKQISKLQKPIIYISENVKLDSTVFQLEAHDNDVDNNAIITYNILSENCKNISEPYEEHFIINSETGQVSIKKLLPGMDVCLYVRAIDGGNLADEIQLKIHITWSENDTTTTSPPKQQRFIMSFFQTGAFILSCIVFIATFLTFLYISCARRNKRTYLKSADPFLTANVLTNHHMQGINFEQLFSKNFQLGQNTCDHESNSDIRLSSFPNCRASMDTDKKFVTSATSLYSCCHDSGVIARVCHCNNMYNSETSSQKSNKSYEDSLKSFQRHSLSSNIESFTNYPTHKMIQNAEKQFNFFSRENNVKDDVFIHKHEQSIAKESNNSKKIMNKLPTASGTQGRVLY